MRKILFVSAIATLLFGCHAYKFQDDKGHDIVITKKTITYPLYDSSGIYQKDSTIAVEKDKLHFSYTELADAPPIDDTIPYIPDHDYLNSREEDIIEKLRREYNDAVSFSDSIVQLNPYQIHFIDTVILYDTIVQLYATIDSPQHKIKMEFYFDRLYNDCDSFKIEFYGDQNPDCILWNYLSGGFREWRQLDSDTYLSTRNPNKIGTITPLYGIPKMQLERFSGGDPRLVMYFSIPTMRKKDWKELVSKTSPLSVEPCSF